MWFQPTLHIMMRNSDFRIVKVENCEAVPKSKKLL